MKSAARYDGYAVWYDAHLTSFAQRATSLLRNWLGPGPGRCLELGCGGGVQLTALVEAGWFAAGIDVSSDQLHVAKQRRGARCLVQGDARITPFRGACFDAVVGAFIHTDVDDWSGVLSEAARLVRPGGRVVYIGTHPCFIGPFSRYPGAEPPRLHAGYRRTARTYTGPGLRRRVGVQHVPLDAFLNAFFQAGLRIDHVEEPGPEEYPRVIALAVPPVAAALVTDPTPALASTGA